MSSQYPSEEAVVQKVSKVGQSAEVCIVVDGVEVVGRVAVMCYGRTLEIVHPYRNMRVGIHCDRLHQPDPGVPGAPIHPEVERACLELAKSTLRDLYADCRRLEREMEGLKVRLEEVRTLEEERMEELGAIQKWEDRRVELKARRSRGELDRQGYSRELSQLNAERQRLRKAIVQEAEDFVNEDLRGYQVLGPYSILTVLEGRASLTEERGDKRKVDQA